VPVRAPFCAQVTWNALRHLPFPHWMSAPCASRVRMQVEHFYNALHQFLN
jgi:hypothetical protein